MRSSPQRLVLTLLAAARIHGMRLLSPQLRSSPQLSSGRGGHIACKEHANLILVRHGQSEWNLANRFTGWVDVDLTERGITEAREAGKMLRRRGLGVVALLPWDGLHRLRPAPSALGWPS